MNEETDREKHYEDLRQAEHAEIGRFGHHTDPAVDFCIEVDAIEGAIADFRAGLEKRFVVEKRIFEAMQFRVGGDEAATVAKAKLRAFVF